MQIIKYESEVAYWKIRRALGPPVNYLRQVLSYAEPCYSPPPRSLPSTPPKFFLLYV